MEKIATMDIPIQQKVAIVGATGLVGRMMATVLTERNILAEYVLYNTLGGADINVCGRTITTLALTPENIAANPVDYALFSAGGDVSKKFAPMFTEQGATVIDNSSSFRRDPDKILCVPECNGALLTGVGPGSIIANPNCTTIAAMVVLGPFDRVFKLQRAVYTSYQAISGAGANPQFKYPIENNVITHIDGEEEKMAHETRKILGRQNIGVSATCCRVPIRNCHTIAVNAQFKKRIDIERMKDILRSAPGVVFLNDELPMPIIADNRDQTFVGRLRIDDSQKNTVNFIVVSDNIRKGAATNAVQILECLMRL